MLGCYSSRRLRCFLPFFPFRFDRIWNKAESDGAYANEPWSMNTVWLAFPREVRWFIFSKLAMNLACNCQFDAKNLPSTHFNGIDPLSVYLPVLYAFFPCAKVEEEVLCPFGGTTFHFFSQECRMRDCSCLCIQQNTRPEVELRKHQLFAPLGTEI